MGMASVSAVSAASGSWRGVGSCYACNAATRSRVVTDELKCELCGEILEDTVSERKVIGSGGRIARKIVMCAECAALIQALAEFNGRKFRSLEEYLAEVAKDTRIN